MNVVFCLVNCDDEYGTRDLVAVFSTREKAVQYCSDKGFELLEREPHQWAAYCWDSGYWIEEMTLDNADAVR